MVFFGRGFFKAVLMLISMFLGLRIFSILESDELRFEKVRIDLERMVEN